MDETSGGRETPALTGRQLTRNRLGRRSLLVVGVMSAVVYLLSVVPATVLAMSTIGPWLVLLAGAVVLICFFGGAYGDVGDVTNRIAARLAPSPRGDRDHRVRLTTPIGTYVREDGRFVRARPSGDLAGIGPRYQVLVAGGLIVSFVANLLLARGAPEVVGDGYVIFVKGVPQPVSRATYVLAEGAIARLWATAAIVLALEGWYRLRRLSRTDASIA